MSDDMAKAKPAKPSGWKAVASNLAGTDKQDTLFATATAIVRAPIQGPVDLALRDDYGGHLKFFSTVVAGVHGLMFVTLPNWSAASLGEAAVASPAKTALYMTVQYMLLVVCVPLFYVVLRRFTGTERTPMSYFKLTLYAAAGGSLAYAAAFYPSMLAWGLWTLDDPDPSRDELQRVLWWLFQIAGLAATLYVSAVAARFWNTRWAYVLAGMLLAAFPIGYLTRGLFGLLSHLPG